MIACSLSFLNQHSTEKKAPYAKGVQQAAVMRLLPHIAPVNTLLGWLHGGADRHTGFEQAIRHELGAGGPPSSKLLYTEYDVVCIEELATSDTRRLVPIIDYILGADFATKLHGQKMLDTATLVIPLKARHPEQDPKTSVCIYIKRSGENELHIEVRPVKGRRLREEIVVDDACERILDVIFDLRIERIPYRVGFARLTPLFRTVPSWDLKKHVICKPDRESSVMPYHIAKLLATHLGSYMRMHVIGAATNADTQMRDLTFGRVEYQTNVSNIGCLAKLTAAVHPSNGTCWCGIYPRCDECAEPKPDDQKSVNIDVRCCGRTPYRFADGTYHCPVHAKTAEYYHPLNQQHAICTAELLVTVNCIHQRYQTTEEIASEIGQKYIPEYQRPLDQRKKWTETRVAFACSNEHERKLLVALLNASIRMHNMLAAYGAESGGGADMPELAERIRVEVIREAAFLKAAITPEAPSTSDSVSTTDTDTVDEVVRLGEDQLVEYDHKVCELLRERKLWTSVPRHAIWAVSNIKKSKYKTSSEAERLARCASVLAQAVVTSKVTMRQFSHRKSGTACVGGSTLIKLPLLYRRLAPAQLQPAPAARR